jgi:hypothetical protein
MCVNSTRESQSAVERGSVALASTAHGRWTLMNSTAQAVAAWALLARPHATLLLLKI